MLKIDGITSDFSQRHTLSLVDGTSVNLGFSFVESQQMWIMDVDYEPSSFKVRGLTVVNNFDILYQWRRIIPFGIACLTLGDRNPEFIRDFESGYAELYLLLKEDKNYYQSFVEA